MSKAKKNKSKTLEQRVLARLMVADVDGAEPLIEQMIEEDEENPVALALMAEVCHLRGASQDALGLVALAIERAPDNPSYLESFISYAKRLSFSFSEYNPLMFRTVQACVVRDDINCAQLWHLWLALLNVHPDLSALRKADISFGDKKTAELVTHPFFIGGLNNLVVIDSGFERLLVMLRDALRQSLRAEKALWSSPDILRVASSLARYAYAVEYIFDQSDEETRWVEELRQRASKTPSDLSAEEIAVFACYDTLATLPATAALLAVCDAEAALKPIADMQIREADRLAKIRQNIPSVTPVDDSASAAVQGQCDAIPYPRWIHLPVNKMPGRLERQLPQDARILVAGCGTGFEAVQVATALPKADILAVDLDGVNLSYAIARVQDAGMENIRFAQGDILRMADRVERYDYIRSTGVLHHMQDPQAAWQSLRNILKPRGIMRVALYSEYGRQDVAAARAVIAEKGFAATREGMKDFRRQIDKLLPADVCQSLRRRGDFYQLSMLHDLLFDVREHRFTLPQLAEILAALKLEFVQFDLVPGALRAFKEMHGPSADEQDLQKWDALEKEKPETFRAMYQFWCRAGK